MDEFQAGLMVESPVSVESNANRQNRIAALNHQGSEAYNAGKFGEPIAAWQEALALPPRDPGLRHSGVQAIEW
jgi:Flp pilus assembly protein TadD